jgi:transcriptional regulator with XRE-family HTH domain
MSTPEDRPLTLDEVQARLAAEVPGYAEAATEEAQGLAFCDSLRADLRRQRKAQGLTLADVAERMEVSPSSVSHFETGSGNLNLMTAWRYARAMGRDLQVSVGPPQMPDMVARAEAETMTVLAAVETARAMVAGYPAHSNPFLRMISGLPDSAFSASDRAFSASVGTETFTFPTETTAPGGRFGGVAGQTDMTEILRRFTSLRDALASAAKAEPQD